MKPTKIVDKIDKNSSYFCFKGLKNDGHDFIDEAIKKGCKLIYGTKDLKIKNYVKVNNIEEEYVKACQKFYHFSENKMKFIGITGTDGKTSCALIISKLLSCKEKVAYLGTSGFLINNQKIKDYSMTTPFAEDLYEAIEIANQKKCKYFVMEVSSHALEQNRLGKNFKFEHVIFTNLTSEHLDFHHTIEIYLNAKKKILNHVLEENVIINGDDKYFKSFITNKMLTYGYQKENKYQIKEVDLNIINTKFKYLNDNKITTIEMNLIAEFNVYNMLASIICIKSLGYNINDFKEEIKTINIEGRLEKYYNKNKPLVIIDFAHTPEAIEKVLKFIKEFNLKKMVIVNGCAGERDTIKRPIIGLIMEKYCDEIILTTDDPRFEDVCEINKQIKKEMKKEPIEIIDRKEAIKYGLKITPKEGVLILLGKGGQNVQYIKDKKVKYSEQETLKELLGE